MGNVVRLKPTRCQCQLMILIIQLMNISVFESTYQSLNVSEGYNVFMINKIILQILKS